MITSQKINFPLLILKGILFASLLPLWYWGWKIQGRFLPTSSKSYNYLVMAVGVILGIVVAIFSLVYLRKQKNKQFVRLTTIFAQLGVLTGIAISLNCLTFIYVGNLFFSVKPAINLNSYLKTSPTAEKYLEEALTIMQKHSINRNKIDWVELKAKMYKLAQGAQTTKDTYPVILEALKELEDHHSLFFTPTEMSSFSNMTVEENLSPRSEILDNHFAYLEIPGFRGLKNEEMIKHANNIQNLIRELDKQKPCGWIIDLRRNGGGNMWPMIAGLGPVLGEGNLGGFIDGDGEKFLWSYENGHAKIDDISQTIVEKPYQLSKANPPVAVLTSPITASSGEIVVVAFRGRSKTKSFGEPTAGLSTSNSGFPLSDGATIFLTTDIDIDRNGNLYGQAISPDQLVELGDWEKASWYDDKAIQAAFKWLKSQPDCKK